MVATEDSLAYLRDAREFRNLLIAEIPNGDWAKTIMKLFLFSTWQFYLFQQLINASDKQLAAIAEKSLKEVTYHVRWSSEWVIRLGDGTEESNRRIKAALEEVWPFTGEMFLPAEYEKSLLNTHVSVNVSDIRNDWNSKVKLVLEEATLDFPENKNTWMQTGGKNWNSYRASWLYTCRDAVLTKSLSRLRMVMNYGKNSKKILQLATSGN